jgi:AraC-like DNA-binding protein
MSALERADHRAETGVSDYDRAVFLLPPPAIRTTVQTTRGIVFVEQVGHSRIGARATQEVHSRLLDRDALLLFPDGWTNTEIHVRPRVLRGLGGLQGFVFPRGAEVRWVTPPTTARALHLHFPEGMLAEMTQASAPPRRPGFLTIDDRFRHLTGALLRDVGDGSIAEPWLLESYAMLFGRYLSEPRAAAPVSRGGLAGWQLERVTGYVMARLASDIALAELASIAGLSPYHFARAFKQSTGLPPHAWLTARRTERAQALMLAHPAMPLIDVALAVGYASHTAFGAAFKRVVGAPPAEWRRERLG